MRDLLDGSEAGDGAVLGPLEECLSAPRAQHELRLDRSRGDRVHGEPGIYAEDALAWGLYRTGRCDEARWHSVRALRLGTRDALLVFHRAMIERCLRSPSARSWFRRALGINPHFSFLWAPVARAQLLRSLSAR